MLQASKQASKCVSGLTVMSGLPRLEILQYGVVMRSLCLVCQTRIIPIHHEFPLSLHMLIWVKGGQLASYTHRLSNIRYMLIRGLSTADN
jgi:hypothetical protein